MLNDIIKIDLHIHSKASEYKDGTIVAESSLENLDSLVEKLNENGIALCAVTDHNRFDYDLYLALRDKAGNNQGSFKHNLPGVEFDVQLEEDKPKCHIIAIFDDKDPSKIAQIEEKMFGVRKLFGQDDVYTVDELERVIKAIGTSVILIVHQRQGLSNDMANSDSLSGATSNPAEFLRVGFVDCLEYNRPRVEGIIKDSLREINMDFPIITGSDCHEWSAYPYHDSQSNPVQRNFTKFKCLPTFKGLLMSITSFSTRVNRRENNNSHYIKSISINGTDYPLANGINVIIGDNGSGKTLLAGVLANAPERHYERIIESNSISVEYNNTEQNGRIVYVGQGEIREQVNSGRLFNGDDGGQFNNISTRDQFASQIRQYFDALYNYVTTNIDKNVALQDLAYHKINITPVNREFYRLNINESIDNENSSIDKQRLDKLDNIISSLKTELNNSYYDSRPNLKNTIMEGLSKLSEAYAEVRQSWDYKEMRNMVKAIVRNEFSKLKTCLQNKTTSEELGRKEKIESYEAFVNSIVDCAKQQMTINEYPDFPDKISGSSSRDFKGYKFTKIANYNNVNLEGNFYKYCFNRAYQSREAIEKIKTKEELNSALSYSDSDQINQFRRTKIDGFIDKYSEEKTFISEISSRNTIGNTPGEVSLVYYKFKIQEESEDPYDILIIDQPEDDINPGKINSYLNSYIGLLRDTKQVIIVTHNPLLVVNLDVDNVLHLTKRDDKIEVRGGALEYENDEYSVLNLIRDNLDGGYNVIERRLKLYDRDNN